MFVLLLLLLLFDQLRKRSIVVL